MRLFFSLSIFMLTAFFTLHLQSALADTPMKVDSLKLRLDQESGPEKLFTYLSLISSIRNIDPASGINYAKEALTLANSIGNQSIKAKILNEQGVCYKKLNIPEKALQLHLESLNIFESLSDSVGIAFTLANIGNVYHQFNELEKALDYHFRSLFLKEYLNNQPQIAYSQNAIGMVLADMGDYTRALDFYISAMAIRKKYNQMLDLANVYANIGKVMMKLSRPEEAIDYLEKALEVYVLTNNEYGQSLVLNQMAELHVSGNQIPIALEKLHKAEKIALKLKNNSVLHYNYKLQKEIYKKLKDSEKALYYAENTSSLKDSLFTERRNYEIQELQVRYETQRLDSENEILKLKLTEQTYRIRYIISGAFIILLVITGFFIFRMYLRKKKNEESLKLANLTLEHKVEERTIQLNEQIKEKQVAYNSLKQSQEHLKVINDTSPFGIAVTNSDGRIILFNQRLSESTGINGTEFTDSTWLRHIIHEDRKNVESYWQNAHKYQGSLPDLNFRVRDANTIRWLRIKGAPMKDDNGFMGLVVVMENITESKKFEQDLIKAKNKAEESDLLKSAFLANMSHEIRTPMNAILGFSDLLSSDDYTNEEKLDFIEMIRSSGKLLLNLINDIIDISKIEAGELKIQHTTFKIAPTLDELFYTFRQQLDQLGKSEVKLILSGREAVNDLEITTDKLRLVQILTNLLSNASKFTQTGQIEFGMIHIGEKLEFFVKDTGIGIPESKLDVIFERFRQADDSHTRVFGGTGLGLAITKNLTQLLGGSIWVESVQNKGAVFYFTLPAHGVASIKDQFYPDYSNKTILIAEDVETNFFLMNGMLRYTKTNVLHASNGLIAVDMALEMQPDLIFMDIQMPELDGLDALKQLKKKNFKQPIIAISAFALSDEGDKFLKLGFDSYLSKPLSIEKVIGVMKLFLKNNGTLKN